MPISISFQIDSVQTHTAYSFLSLGIRAPTPHLNTSRNHHQMRDDESHITLLRSTRIWDLFIRSFVIRTGWIGLRNVERMNFREKSNWDNSETTRIWIQRRMMFRKRSMTPIRLDRQKNLLVTRYKEKYISVWRPFISSSASLPAYNVGVYWPSCSSAANRIKYKPTSLIRSDKSKCNEDNARNVLHHSGKHAKPYRCDKLGLNQIKYAERTYFFRMRAV